MSCICSHIKPSYNPCWCGCNHSCGCECPPVTTSTTITTTTCANGEPCEEALDPRCILYCGPDLPCYGIKTGDSAADIMSIILNLLGPCTTTTTTTSTTTSTSTSTTTSTSTSTTTSTSTSTTSTTSTSTSTTTTTTSNSQRPADAFVCQDCTPSLDGIVSTPSELQVGNLVVSNPSCILTDYAIEWYLDSISNGLQFVSGNSGNTDPAIQQFHPFTRPVVAGNWIPVIRYVVVGGLKYYSTDVLGELYSPDLYNCLSPTPVEPFACLSTNLPGLNYSHELEFNQTVSPTDINRSITFEIGATTNYFAYEFYGYAIPDTLKITYVSGVTTTQLLTIDVGYNNTYTNTYVNPIISALTPVKDVIDLTSFTYTPGDYLLIEIIGNPLNVNTEWLFRCKCLDTFDCSWQVATLNPCNHSLTLDNCTLTLQFEVDNYSDNNNTDIAKYLIPSGFHNIFSNISGFDPITGIATSSVPYGEFCNSFATNLDWTCTPLVGTANATKTGSNIVIQFTNLTDYNDYVATYNSAQTTMSATYTSVVTDINHYQFFALLFRDANFCADSATDYYIATHYTTVFTFDPIALTISFTITNVANGLLSTCPTCVNLDSITACNNSISIPDFNVTSSVRVVIPFFGLQAYQTINTPTQITYGIRSIRNIWNNTDYVCQNVNGFCLVNDTNTPNNYQYLDYYGTNILLEITNTADPTNNYKLYNRLDINGCESIPGSLYYEMENGVVIYDICDPSITTTTTSTTTTNNPPVTVSDIYTMRESGVPLQSGVELWYAISPTQNLTQPEPPGLTWVTTGTPQNLAADCSSSGYYNFGSSINITSGYYLYIQIRTTGGTDIYYTNYDFTNGCSPVNPSFGAYTQCIQINSNLPYIDVPIKFPLTTVPKP